MRGNIRAEDITLSITTLARDHELDKTLMSIGDFPNIQVILNGANLRDYQWVMRKYRGRVKFLRNERNIGVAAAWNQGIVTANTRHVILSGDDLEYSERWSKPLLNILNSDDPPLQVSLSHPLAVSSFCVDKKLMVLQGWFDHNFTRIYYEDEDWSLRFRERLGLYNNPLPFEAISPGVNTVLRPSHKRAPWNSIPNRVYFWRKWKRMAEIDENSLYLRQHIIVGRRLPEPSWWSYRETVRKAYSDGDYGAKPFVYDKPSTGIRFLTWATTNVVFIASRKLVQRLTNPDQQLK